jgi:hypothetical protein
VCMCVQPPFCVFSHSLVVCPWDFGEVTLISLKVLILCWH